VISESGRKKITWIGYSQGTSQMFAALSFPKNQIAEKLDLFIALAPMTRMKNIKDLAFMIFKGISESLARSAIEFGFVELFGASTKQLSHYAQIINGGDFVRYDYGKDENHKRYGRDTPPKYDLTNIDKVPVAMFVGK